MLRGEPFQEQKAKDLIRSILGKGTVSYTSHFREEIGKDKMTTKDCENVLRGGWVEPAEEECGSWRYRVCTQRMCVVVTFRSESELVLITAWRT